jgi:MerR family transcriptional regulator, mercuric resistance operon regulatory protein
MRIGELTERSGVPSSALRYYEQTGLLLAPRRTSTGYRVYDAEVLPRLRFIRSAQAVGLSLADIREILQIRDSGSAPCRHVLGLLEQRRAEVAARRRELEQLERDLTQLGALGKDLDPAECDPSGICGVISLEGHPPNPTGRIRRSQTPYELSGPCELGAAGRLGERGGKLPARADPELPVGA